MDHNESQLEGKGLDAVAAAIAPKVTVKNNLTWVAAPTEGSYLRGERELFQQTDEYANGNRVYTVSLTSMTLADMVNLRDALAQAIEIEIEAGRDKGSA